MKRLIYILSAIIFILVSCTQEIIPDADRGDNCINLTVSSSGMMTKVIEDLNGNANERVIKRLDCFFYPKGNTNANQTALFALGMKRSLGKGVLPACKANLDVSIGDSNRCSSLLFKLSIRIAFLSADDA